MIRGTTPLVKLKVKSSSGSSYIDLSSCVVWITLKDSNGNELDFTNDRITFNSDYSFQVTLTQSETLSLNGRKVNVQVRARDTDNNAIATSQEMVGLDEILKGGVI